MFKVWLSPIIQASIDDEALESLDILRHQLSTSWLDVVKVPSGPGKNYCLLLPFAETFQNAFATMYPREFHPNRASGGRLQLWLNDSANEVDVPAEATAWISTVGKYVAMKDLLALSFAMDFTNEGGNPANAKTSIAILRRQAKPYGGESLTQAHHKAAKKLSEKCVLALKELTCYSGADCVVAVPPSDPSKEYNLPRILAGSIAKDLGVEDLSDQVVTSKKRGSIKEASLAEKLKTLRGTIKVSKNVFVDRTVLLIDDLYQSGTTMNYCAKLLLEAGARVVFGFACEKTCRNDDNQSGG